MRKAGFHCEINGLPKWVATGCTLPRITLPLYIYLYIYIYYMLRISTDKSRFHDQTLSYTPKRYLNTFEYIETYMKIYLLLTYTVAVLTRRWIPIKSY